MSFVVVSSVGIIIIDCINKFLWMNFEWKSHNSMRTVLMVIICFTIASLLEQYTYLCKDIGQGNGSNSIRNLNLGNIPRLFDIAISVVKHSLIIQISQDILEYILGRDHLNAGHVHMVLNRKTQCWSMRWITIGINNMTHYQDQWHEVNHNRDQWHDMTHYQDQQHIRLITVRVSDMMYM